MLVVALTCTGALFDVRNSSAIWVPVHICPECGRLRNMQYSCERYTRYIVYDTDTRMGRKESQTSCLYRTAAAHGLSLYLDSDGQAKPIPRRSVGNPTTPVRRTDIAF